LILLNYLLSELQAAFISAATSGQLDDDFTDTSTMSDTVLNLSLLLTAISGGPGFASTRMSPFWILLELTVMEVMVTAGAIRLA